MRDKVRSVQFIHTKASTKGDRLATGDRRVLTRQALFDTANKPIATLFTDSANLGPRAQVFKATLQCTVTYCHFSAISQFVVCNADYPNWDAFAFARARHITYHRDPPPKPDTASPPNPMQLPVKSNLKAH